MPETINAYDLPERHEGVLLDAFGVLVNRAGVLPGAADFIRHLNARGTPYAILTNAASRSKSALGAHFRSLGLAIADDRVISSGSLAPTHFRKHDLDARPTFVLGPPSSHAFALEGGGRLVEPAEAEVIMITDQSGFPFLDTLDAVLNRIIQRHEAGKTMHLLCCNPDLIYPTTDREFGFTAGTLAGMLERALDERYGEAAPRFHYLGKPYAPIFAAGRALCGSDDLVMVGDQLSTDIRGANRAGMDSALIRDRVGDAKIADDWTGAIATPSYLLDDLLPA